MEHPDPAETSNVDLQPCPICGRTFRPDALQRHQKICEKNATKKRKVFDSSKQRAPEEVKELKSNQPKNNNRATKPKQQSRPPQEQQQQQGRSSKDKSSWREKHEELIKTIKRARGEELKEEEAELKKKVPSGYVECPSCGRHFNERAADRHIPWCQKKAAENPKSPPNDPAKEKLIARVKYRPPQGKSRLLQHRQTKATQSTAVRKEDGAHSSPPTLLDNRQDRINNNLPQNRRNRSHSSGREKEVDLPRHIIKFKERFPNHTNKRSVDFEESLTSEQLRDLLNCSRTADRYPRTVPGVRLSGGGNNRNGGWTYRSSDISRSASSSGGSSNSWNKPVRSGSTLPEVSGSEVLPGTWSSSKLYWNGDLDNSVGSTSSSSSNGSLPPLSRESNEEVALTFYCHQCSSKFPLVGAKYCCECGARRRGLLGLAHTG